VAALGLLMLLGLTSARAVDYHVATAQQLQNALTLAAASSVSNNIYVTNGYYTGNFNFNSANINSLTLLAETNIASSQIVIDSGGTGSSMSITASASPNITVQGMTFLRNCGSNGIGGLQIAGGNTTILVNGCQFLSPTNSAGIGLNLLSGINATVTNCTAVGSSIGGGGTGIYIAGVTNNVTIQNCSVITNGLNNGNGLCITGAGSIAISGNLFIGNNGTYFSGTTITLTHNAVIGNLPLSHYGGAVCYGTTVTLSGNSFTGNSVGWPGSSGGGAYCSGTTITLSGNNFTGNSALNTSGWGGTQTFGGGAYCSGTTVTLFGNTFIGNSASNVSPCCGTNAYGFGGGVCCYGITILSNNTFIANSAAGYSSLLSSGGAAFCYSSATNPTVICGNTFQQNTATLGGAVYASGPTINLLDNLILNNAATTTSAEGGGIWVDASATLNMINNTVTGNTSAGTGGGAAYIVTGTVELLNVYNNIIFGNLATVNGGDVYLSGTGKKKVFNFNDADSYYGVWDIALNNKDVSPQFFDPVNGDYHFPGTSPCANAGTNGAPALPLTDLDGNSRTNSAGFVDMGCYEFNTTATHPADTDTNFIITPAEFYAYAAAWQNGQTWTNAPNPIPANYLTRAGYLMTNGGAYYNDGSARPLNWKLIGH
jgi:hypothetical protein